MEFWLMLGSGFALLYLAIKSIKASPTVQNQNSHISHSQENIQTTTFASNQTSSHSSNDKDEDGFTTITIDYEPKTSRNKDKKAKSQSSRIPYPQENTQTTTPVSNKISSHSRNDKDEDGFAIITIDYGPKKSRNKKKEAENQSSHISHSQENTQTTTFISNQISHCSNNDKGEDDFSLITIAYNLKRNKNKKKQPGRWVKPGESIFIHGHTITSGNFYYGSQLTSLDGYGTEASLIDDTLNVTNQPLLTYKDESLNYWSKYESIFKKCRGALLNWLSSERNNPDIPIGYIFIYFYGLERRIIVDSIDGKVDDFEFKNIFEEIIRLKNIYGTSISFLSYTIRLLEIMCVLRPEIVLNMDLEKNPKKDSILLKYNLAKAVNKGEPISEHLALAWLKFSPEYSLKKPARRCTYEFNQLFSRTYTKKHIDGIIIKPNKTRLKIEYRPANPTLLHIKVPHEDLPDPSSLKSPINKLITIAEECTKALEAYSRYLSKPNTSRTDIAAILLLPNELNDINATFGLNKIKQWVEDSIVSNNGIVDFSELWQFTKTPIPEKINKKESELIQSLADKIGFGLVPDSRYHHTKPSIDGKVVLFSGGHGKYFKPSAAFNEMGMTLRLGAMVAIIDSHVDETEFEFLKQLINHDSNLSPTEKNSLHSYLIWLLNTTTSNITGLKARLEKLGVREKSAVSKILIGVALADGKIDPDEVKQLEKLYTLLGLDKSLVTGDIHNATTHKATAPVQATSKAVISRAKSLTGFELDENALALHESQTKDVQNMLNAIFVDEDFIEETLPPEKYDENKENMSIDAQHYALYENLINRDKWLRNEVDELCKKLGLMTNGAIETINEWSFEKADAPVLEEEANIIYIDHEIAKELEG